LIKLQNKWQDRLEVERKKATCQDSYKNKIQGTILQEQTLLTASKEPTRSIKASVKVKAKTNNDVKEDVRGAILGNIEKRREKLNTFKATIKAKRAEEDV